MRDLYSNLAGAVALVPAVQTASVNGAVIDLRQSSGVIFALSTGAIAGAGDFSAKVQESLDGSTFADAPAKVVKSNAPATLLADKAYKLGYNGAMPFARLVLSRASGTSIIAGAVAVLRPLVKPAP